ncbi:hypothetical protein YPPY61_0695 [Yersinia pestis PY-61]|nr:hypothetical protein YPPY61_0695 [Yersinia pestis PY-61]
MLSVCLIIEAVPLLVKAIAPSSQIFSSKHPDKLKGHFCVIH